MTSDESDAITSYNLDDDPHDDLPARSYWWSLHRPETYAIAALGLALVTLMSLAPSQELAQSILVAVHSPSGEKDYLYALAGIRLGLALIAIVTAMLSVRAEDEDTTWSPPLARAALLLAVLSALLSVAALITTATVSDNEDSGF